MKIGIVTEYYYPLLGGITENVHNSRLKLRQMGHEVKIITSNCNGSKFAMHEGYDAVDPDVVRIGRSVPIYSNGSFGYFTIGRKLRTRVRKILTEGRFDLLHIHSPIVFTLPPLALLEARCPVVATFHTYFDGHFIYSMFKGVIQRRGIDKLDGQIFVSRRCVESLNKYFKLDPRIIPNGVDIEQFNPDVPRYEKYDDGKMNLLFLSRFDPRNGLALMLQAFKLVKSQFPDVRLIIVGDGPLGFYYKRLIPQGLENDIHFEGLARSLRPRYYASCDIFCSPVMKASFGVTLLEAMASGKPTVATENCGYKGLLSEDVGFLVPPDNPPEFARAIVRLLKDDRLRREMGINARRNSLRYSWNSIVCEITDFYEEVLRRR